MQQYRVVLDGIEIGVLTETRQDQPWIHCHFSANSAYEPFREMFEEEARLLESGGERWEEALAKLLSHPLCTLTIPDGRRIDEVLLHLSGSEAWWRG